MSRQPTIASNLRRLIAEKGTNPSAVSKLAQLGHTAARDIILGKTRNPTDRVLSALAGALGVTVADLTGDATPAAGTSSVGESDASPYAISTSTERGQNHVELMHALAPHALSPAAYILGRYLPGLAMNIGDMLVIDLGRRPESGDVVVATIADLETGEAQTVVRRFLQPYLVAGDAGDRDAIVVDGARTSIIAPVEAVYRTRG